MVESTEYIFWNHTINNNMSVAVNNNVENHDEHHHKETFITKWICSQDHKMIAKQYFVTGVIVMGIIGVVMSLLFRIQLAWPEESFSIFNFCTFVFFIYIVCIMGILAYNRHCISIWILCNIPYIRFNWENFYLGFIFNLSF